MIPAPGILVPSLCTLMLAFPCEVPAQSFDTMAQPVETDDECKAPRPPKDLAETAYIRNGYRAILRIMAAEKWQETKECICFLTDFTWAEVVKRSEKLVTSDNPRLPFDVVALDEQAANLEGARLDACSIE
ncbi:hypothetical protein OCH239_10005 [Roseivivax halodurans JCM 10272]|uniref:Uncharacterized protein n=1 Tax=Roseivivax halodurans JCM 10272 TaxID=1449350 RepID=X7ECD0_9RHOB|nr:hypothetical protein [Roseivivax halodurans]ETX13515.1 hypothetical protein OCH239_10005 [Roseivivax halodurans JCM 10272]